MRKSSWLTSGLFAVTLTAAMMFWVAPASAASCAVRPSKTIVRDGGVRIYRVGRDVYACSARFGRRVLLEHRAGFPFAHVEISNRLLAYALPVRGGDRMVVASRDLKTGALIRRHVQLPDGCTAPGGYVSALVMNARGSIAWTIFTCASEDGDTEVWKDDTTGATELDMEPPMGCDSPPEPGCDNIDDTYLVAANGQVMWKANGEIRSAPFD